MGVKEGGEFQVNTYTTDWQVLGPIANLGDNVTSQVFNDHAANYCYIESANIKEDREHFINTINSYIKDPRFLTMKRKIPR